MAVSSFNPSSPRALPRDYAAGPMPSWSSIHLTTPTRTRMTSTARSVSCKAALKSEPGPVRVSPPPLVPGHPAPPPSQQPHEEGENDARVIGARVRVMVPVKVYHVPRVPVMQLAGMEGTVRQYVGVFRGANLSASLPFKVEFVKEMEGGSGSGSGNRGALVKFTAHLKQDEFDYI